MNARSADNLVSVLHHIDGMSYKAYKQLTGGVWELDASGVLLLIDYVQGDPYAAPSRARVRVPMEVAAFPPELYCRTSKPPSTLSGDDDSKQGDCNGASWFDCFVRRTALCDYLTRVFGRIAESRGYDISAHGGVGGSRGNWAGSKGGDIRINMPGQNVIQRSSVIVTSEYVEARFTVGLPARGRTLLGHQAIQILTQNVPDLARLALTFAAMPNKGNDLRRQVLSCEDQEVLRASLSAHGLVAFVRDGSILPRRSGVDDRPMNAQQAVSFQAPDSMRVTLRTPNGGTVSGMGIRRGVTLIVGGGFHGKSTLLQALEVGIYNKVIGDGREFVISNPAAVKVRAEDGRCIHNCNISPFINNLPFGKDTSNFVSEDGSGSTSQAANIIEALEMQSSLLLVDEDTSATNFMIRDRRMQMLVSADKEPITPFIGRIRQMYSEHGVSVVLVIGGSGDYFDVADAVIMMDCYQPVNVTDRALSVAESMNTNAFRAPESDFGAVTQRTPVARSIVQEPSDGFHKHKIRSIHEAEFSGQPLDLSGVEQLVEKGQTRAICHAMVYVARAALRSDTSLLSLLESLEHDLDGPRGLNTLAPAFGDLVRPRRFEIAGALNRLRSVKWTLRTA